MKHDSDKSHESQSDEAMLKAFRDEFADVSELMQVIGAREPTMDSRADRPGNEVDFRAANAPSPSWWIRPYRWAALAATFIVGLGSGLLWVQSTSSQDPGGRLEFVKIQGIDVRGGLEADLRQLLSSLPDDIDLIEMNVVDWQSLQREGLPDGSRARVLVDPFASQFVLLVRSAKNYQATIIWRTDFNAENPLWPQLEDRLLQLGLL